MNSELELRLLTVGGAVAPSEHPDAVTMPTPTLVARLAGLIVDGHYAALFDDESVRALLTARVGLSASSPLELLRSCEITSATVDPDVAFLVGVAALLTFTQLNYTGPNIPELPVSPFALGALIPGQATSPAEASPLDGSESEAVAYLPTAVPRLQYSHYRTDWHTAAIAELSADGEAAYHLAFYPAYLLLATNLLLAPAAAPTLMTAPVWRARCARVHLELLLEPAVSLYTRAIEDYAAALALPALTANRRLHTRLLVEAAVTADVLGRHDLARRDTTLAFEVSRLGCTLTGALGKRTKHQTFTTTHLVVTAQSGLGGHAAGASGVDARRPELIKNEDWDLLEEITFDAPIVDEALGAEELALLLAKCLDVKSHNPTSVLTDEEIAPYARRVLNNAGGSSWLVAAQGLLVRSRLEIKGKKTLERAMGQIQSLLDERNNPTAPGGLSRLADLFALAFPPWWDLQRELGALFLKLGLSRAALDMFEPLEMWDEIVQCYVAVGSTRRAEIIIRQRLAAAASPIMHCVLGDILDDASCYATAWALSGGHFPRAQRTWGALCFRRKEYGEAIAHFKLALDVNPIFPSLWFTMGMAAMFLEAWAEGAYAFSRCVQYDPENGEAWGNLAGIYQRMGEPRRAFTCLAEALKQKRESWRLWENYLYVCMQLGEHLTAMRAVRAVLETNSQAKVVDARVIKALVGVYAGMIVADPDSRDTRFFRERLGQLFDFVLEQTTSVVGVWEAYAALAGLEGDNEAAYARRLSQYRAAQVVGWETDADKLAEVVRSAEAALAALAVLAPPEEVAVSLRLSLASAYKQSARMLEGNADRARLRGFIISLGGDPDEDVSVRA